MPAPSFSATSSRLSWPSPSKPAAALGSYRPPVLLDRYGPTLALPDVLVALPADCPRCGAGQFLGYLRSRLPHAAPGAPVALLTMDSGYYSLS